MLPTFGNPGILVNKNYTTDVTIRALSLAEKNEKQAARLTLGNNSEKLSAIRSLEFHGAIQNRASKDTDAVGKMLSSSISCDCLCDYVLHVLIL